MTSVHHLCTATASLSLFLLCSSLIKSCTVSACCSQPMYRRRRQNAPSTCAVTTRRRWSGGWQRCASQRSARFALLICIWLQKLVISRKMVTTSYLISVFTFSCWLTCLVQCFDAVRPSRSVVKMQTSPARHLYVTLRLFTSRTAIAWRRCYCFHWRPFVCLLCVRVCQHDNCWSVWDIAMKFLREQYVVRSSDQFEHGCIPVHCGAAPGWWFDVADVPVYLYNLMVVSEESTKLQACRMAI